MNIFKNFKKAASGRVLKLNGIVLPVIQWLAEQNKTIDDEMKAVHAHLAVVNTGELMRRYLMNDEYIKSELGKNINSLDENKMKALTIEVFLAYLNFFQDQASNKSDEYKPVDSEFLATHYKFSDYFQKTYEGMSLAREKWGNQGFFQYLYQDIMKSFFNIESSLENPDGGQFYGVFNEIHNNTLRGKS